MAIVYQDGVAGKICANPDCGWKPLSEFHPRRHLGIPIGDGHKSRCKNCFNAQARDERATNLEHYQTREREYVEANKDHYREIGRKSREKHAEDRNTYHESMVRQIVIN